MLPLESQVSVEFQLGTSWSVVELVPAPLVVSGKRVLASRSWPSYSKVVRLFSASLTVATRPLSV
jgi:hypothetical protein